MPLASDRAQWQALDALHGTKGHREMRMRRSRRRRRRRGRLPFLYSTLEPIFIDVRIRRHELADFNTFMDALVTGVRGDERKWEG